MKKEKGVDYDNVADEEVRKNGEFSKKMMNVNGSESEVQTKPNTLGLKIDLANMDRSNTMGFHDEFYSKLDEFSESWRNQALREKRF